MSPANFLNAMENDRSRRLQRAQHEEPNADEILRVCSYHRHDYDLVMVRSRPREMLPVQGSLQAAFKTSPVATLAVLDSLPPELMSMILRALDLQSLFHFRQVNRRARLSVADLWEYQLVSTHGLEGLRCLLRAELACYYTIDDLYQPLLTDQCSSCGAFGSHLFLFTVERCCIACLESLAHYRVISVSAFANLARVSPSRLNRLERLRLRTVPGIYNMMKTKRRRPTYLLLEEGARQALLAMKAIGESAVERLRQRTEQEGQRFMAATAYPSYDLKTTHLQRGVSCKGCQVRLEVSHANFEERDRVYSEKGFLSHFAHCQEALDLWAKSEGGTKPVDEPALTRCGGFMSPFGPDGLPA